MSRVSLRPSPVSRVGAGVSRGLTLRVRRVSRAPDLGSRGSPGTTRGHPLPSGSWEGRRLLGRAFPRDSLRTSRPPSLHRVFRVGSVPSTELRGPSGTDRSPSPPGLTPLRELRRRYPRTDPPGVRERCGGPRGTQDGVTGRTGVDPSVADPDPTGSHGRSTEKSHLRGKGNTPTETRL